MKPSELITAVRVISRGDILLAPTATRLLVEAYMSAAASEVGATPTILAADITERETEILSLLAAGLSNAEIAHRLVISLFTVKFPASRACSPSTR